MSGLLSFLLPVLMVALAFWFFIRMRRARNPKKTKDTHRTRQERAVWAWAKVLSATRSPTGSGNRTRVEMELEVHLPGTPPYVAKTAWQVEADGLAYVEEGKEISLKVDPLGPQYVYPNGPWAKFME